MSRKTAGRLRWHHIDDIGADAFQSGANSREPTTAEVADVATFLASDRASALTATIANVSCGAIVE